MPTSSKRRHPGHIVTAVLVCRDGAGRLSDVLDALAHGAHQPNRLVVVTVGNSPDVRAIVTKRHGEQSVVDVAAGTSFGTAVQAGLDAFGSAARPSEDEDAPIEWVWLLHDDSAPEPAALDELLVRVTHSPSVWLVGPKVRDWDDELLLEAGLSIDTTGHIDRGVDGLEPDQGQRDDVDEVLAVGTAGALVRRTVWDELGGLDPAWDEYAADVDFGWRVNAASGRVVVAPRAVVRHAGCDGDRADTAAAEAVTRRNGMQVVLTNTAGWLVPVLFARYLFGGLLRAAGLFLLSRRPRLALAELIGVGQVLTAPVVITAGRRERMKTREVAHADLRRLLPAPASRWRNAPVFAGAIRPEAIRPRRQRVAVETGPVSEEAESLTNDVSIIGAFLRRPASVLFVVMILLAAVADRHLFSSTIHGGRLLPAPSGASDLWSTYFASWHPSGLGSTTPAPTWLAALALLSSVLLGKAWLAVELLMLFAVPLAAVSAFTAMRVVTPSVRIRVWIAVVYSLLPAATGAVAGGRLDVVVAAVVLPRIVRSAGVAITGSGPGTTRGRSVRAGLWLAIGVAFAPLLWPIAVVVLVAAVLFAGAESDEIPLLRRRLEIAGFVLAVPLAICVPWTFHLLAHPSVLLTGSGLPEFYASRSAPSGIALAFFQAGGPAQPPFWVGIPLLAAALLGLQRSSRVAVARTAVVMLVVGLAIAVGETRSAAAAAGVEASRHWPGLALLVGGAGALLSALIAVVGARPALATRSFGWRQPAAVAVVGFTLVASMTIALGWLVRGAGSPLRASSATLLPLFAQAEISTPESPRALVLKTAGPVVSYAVIRRPLGPHLGDADTSPGHTGASGVAGRRLATAVRDLVAGRPGAGAELVPFGIRYVVAPNATGHKIFSELGRATTLSVLPVPGATVWKSSLPAGELTLLSGAAAGDARSGKTPVAALKPGPAVLTAGQGSAHVSVSPATGTRLLVLAEPAGPWWHASLGGKPLQGARAYGWAQAFVVPSSASGRLDLHASGGARDAWLWIELLVVLAVVGLGVAAPPQGAPARAVARTRRSRDADSDPVVDADGQTDTEPDPQPDGEAEVPA